MPTLPQSKLLERYLLAGKVAGCSRDQMENFLRADVVLQPTQLRASAAARECDEEDGPEDVAYGGAMGGGKSHWLICQLGADDCQRAPGLKCLLLRKVGKANKENLEDLRLRCLMHLGHTYNRQEGLIKFANGSRILAGHYQHESDIDAYLGLEYDVIAVEEATTLSPAKIKRIRTRRRTSKPGWRPRMYYTFNPGGIGHNYFKQNFTDPAKRKKETKTRFIFSNVYDNRMVDPGYKSVLEGLVGWEREAWLEGNMDIMAGQFFINWSEEVHVLRPPYREIPKGAVWGCGFDYGFQHYTSCHLLAGWDGAVFVVDEYCERRRLPEQNAAGIKAMLARNGLNLWNLRFVVAGHDCWSKDQHGRTIADDYADNGIELEPANVDRISGAAELQRRLGSPREGIAPRLFVFERCQRLIDCIPGLQHDPHRPEDVLKWDADENGMGGDDPYDDVRYGLIAFTGRDTGGAAIGPTRPVPGGLRTH